MKRTIWIWIATAGLSALGGCQWQQANDDGKTEKAPACFYLVPTTPLTAPQHESEVPECNTSTPLEYEVWQLPVRDLLYYLPPSPPEPTVSEASAVATESPATPEQPREVPGAKRYALGVIGGIEPVYLSPFDVPLSARIDTGAATSSLDARNIKEFERDGQRWVSFDVMHRDSGEVLHFKRRVMRRLRITRTNSFERRYSVLMAIRFGDEQIQAEFTLNDRNDFDYPVLIGRNILAGLAVVDVTMKNTLK